MSAVVARWPALGTTAELLVTDPRRLPAARAAVERELEAIDRACSRFRTDGELVALNAAAGRGPRPLSPVLLEALLVALDAAGRTGGAVDPTVGAAMVAAGYDRDFATLPADGPAAPARPAAGPTGVRVNPHAGTAALDAGVALDLGATAKGFAADRAARAALAAVPPGTGVLVSLGGDLAVAGPPPAGGWAVGVADDHRDRRPPLVVAVECGALATSGLAVRRWRRGGQEHHHVLDPATGRSVAPVWRTASVRADACWTANAFATAALVWGHDAPRRLADAGVAARLVAADGRVVTTSGWATLEPAVGRAA